VASGDVTEELVASLTPMLNKDKCFSNDLLDLIQVLLSQVTKTKDLAGAASAMLRKLTASGADGDAAQHIAALLDEKTVFFSMNRGTSGKGKAQGCRRGEERRAAEAHVGGGMHEAEGGAEGP